MQLDDTLDHTSTLAAPLALEARNGPAMSRWFRLTCVLAIVSFVICAAISAHAFYGVNTWSESYKINMEGWHSANISCEKGRSSKSCEFIRVFHEGMVEARLQRQAYDAQAWTFLYVAAGLPALLFFAYGAGQWVWNGRTSKTRLKKA